MFLIPFPRALEETVDGLDMEVFDIQLEDEDNEVEEEDGEASAEEQESEEDIMVNTKKCIVYEDRLLELLQDVHGDMCLTCREKVSYRSVQKGTALLVTWECCHGHRRSWSSQPKYK